MLDKKPVDVLREWESKVETLRVSMLLDDGCWNGLCPLARQELFEALAFMELVKTHLSKADILQDSK